MFHHSFLLKKDASSDGYGIENEVDAENFIDEEEADDRDSEAETGVLYTDEELNNKTKNTPNNIKFNTTEHLKLQRFFLRLWQITILRHLTN